MTSIISPTTGLPKLPDGFVWNVKEAPYSDKKKQPYFYIQICRQSKFLWFTITSVIVADNVYINSFGKRSQGYAQLTDEAILNSANYLYGITDINSLAPTPESDKIVAAGKNRIGTYPPKKLGA